MPYDNADEEWTVFCLASHQIVFRGTEQECAEYVRNHPGAYTRARGEQRI